MNYHIFGWICLALSMINTYYSIKKNKWKNLVAAAVLMVAAWVNLSMTF